MSFVSASPERLAAAARNLAGIGSTLNASNATAAVPTLAVSAAASDQVSAAVAAFFSGHAHGYQTLSAQAAKFHTQFVRALTANASSYDSAESANSSPLRQLLGAAPAAEPAPPGDVEAAKATTAAPAGTAFSARNMRGGAAGATAGPAAGGTAKGTGACSATEAGAPTAACGGGGLLLRAGVASAPEGDWTAGAARAAAAGGLVSRLVDEDGSSHRSGGSRNGVWLDGIRGAGQSAGIEADRGAAGSAASAVYSRGGAGGSAQLGGLWGDGWSGGRGNDTGAPAFQRGPGTGGSGGFLSRAAGISSS